MPILLPAPAAMVAPHLQETQRATIALTYLTPYAALWRLDTRSRGLFPHFVDNTKLIGPSADGRGIEVEGTPGGIAKVRGLLAPLDHADRQARLSLSVIVAEFKADGSVSESPAVRDVRPNLTVGQPYGFGMAGRGVGGFGVRALCRIADEKLLLDLRLERGRRPLLTDTTARLRPAAVGQPLRVAGWTDAVNPDLRKAIELGERPPKGFVGKVFYLEATPLSVTGPATADSCLDVLSLRNVAPDEALIMAGPLEGLGWSSADSRFSLIQLEGPRGAVAAARARLAALDRAPTRVTLSLRLVRVVYTVSGEPTETIVKAVKVATEAGKATLAEKELPCSAIVRALPQPDGRVWIFPQLRLTPTGARAAAAPRVQGGVPALLKHGQARRLAGVPRTDDLKAFLASPARREAFDALIRGAEPTNGLALTAYFLDVSVAP